MLEDTGERVIPEEMSITNELLIEHVARYHFALPFIKKGRVLDMASGSGFGTHIIAVSYTHLTLPTKRIV